jgi:hypothetical protein
MITMNEFIIGNEYVDRGPNYKRFEDDQFSSWLVDDSKKTIPPIGGVRFKQFVNLEIYSSEISDQKIPPYIILISSFIDSEFDNPWNDKILEDDKIIYWGDANGKKNNHMSYPGNKAIKNISFLNKNSREIVPPILHFSKFKKGVLTFNGLCALEKIKKDTFISTNTNKKVNNFKCYLEVFKNINVKASWLVERANSFDPEDADRKYAPKAWNNYKESGSLPKIIERKIKDNSSINSLKNFSATDNTPKPKTRKLIWNNERNTVLMWILYHNGFSIADDSNPANKIIADALDVKRTSLDMMARHIKHHLLRLDLYGKKYRGSNSLKTLIDMYRPDLRNLKQDANNIAKEQGWYESLVDYL